jgi:hypothetical protein
LISHVEFSYCYFHFLLKLRLLNGPDELTEGTFIYPGVGASIFFEPIKEHSNCIVVATTGGFLSKTASH